MKIRFNKSALGALLFILMVFAAFSSCKNQSKISKDSQNQESLVIADSNVNMHKAIILDYSNKPDGCTFLIQLEENRELLQFIELPEEYLVNGKEIWIEFVRSKRPQGSCLLGTPIMINNIKLRN